MPEDKKKRTGGISFSIREEQKKARCGSGLNLFLGGVEETGAIMLHCGTYFQFIFVMTVIRTMYSCAARPAARA